MTLTGGVVLGVSTVSGYTSSARLRAELPSRAVRMRVALVHDWLTGMRGGERVLEQLCVMFPDAEIFTLVHLPGTVSPAIERHRIHTPFIQQLPGVAKHYRN